MILYLTEGHLRGKAIHNTDRDTEGKSSRTGAGGKSQGLAGTTANEPEENQILRYSDSPTEE